MKASRIADGIADLAVTTLVILACAIILPLVFVGWLSYTVFASYFWQISVSAIGVPLLVILWNRIRGKWLNAFDVVVIFLPLSVLAVGWLIYLAFINYPLQTVLLSLVALLILIRWNRQGIEEGKEAPTTFSLSAGQPRIERQTASTSGDKDSDDDDAYRSQMEAARKAPYFSPDQAAVESLANDFATAIPEFSSAVVQEVDLKGRPPSDCFIVDIISVMRSVRLATGDSRLDYWGYVSKLLEPIAAKIRSNSSDRIDILMLLNVPSMEDMVEPHYIPGSLVALERYDSRYGTSLTSSLSSLFVRLIQIAAAGEQNLPPITAKALQSYAAKYCESVSAHDVR